MSDVLAQLFRLFFATYSLEIAPPVLKKLFLEEFFQHFSPNQSRLKVFSLLVAEMTWFFSFFSFHHVWEVTTPN